MLNFVLQAPCLYTGWRWFRFVSQISVSLVAPPAGGNVRRSVEENFVTWTPPTTPHGRFENAFPVWRENLHRSFEFGVEVDPLYSHFWREFGIYNSHC